MLIKVLLSLLAFAMPVSAPAQGKAAGSLTDVTGVWIMAIEGHQVGLELEQKGAAVKGVIRLPGGGPLLEGTYIERVLELKGEKTEDGAPPSAGHLDAGPITARMKDDGTLEGELSTSRGRTKWTGERLQR